jgi:hypothetical protein
MSEPFSTASGNAMTSQLGFILLGGKDIHFLSVGLFAEAAYIKGA